MEETARISDQLKRAFEGGAWHGPALSELLDQLSAAKASEKPENSVHSIWEIVAHIDAWHRVAIKRIHGKMVELSDEEDWPTFQDTSETAWASALRSLKESYIKLQETISKLSGSDLDNMISGLDYSVYFLLHGIIQHDLYHAGQIAILKK
jgi:uncharacterized damage-inducible protein DinB